MRAFTNSAVDAIHTGDVTQEINIDLEEDAMFIPRKSAKHWVPKKFSTKNPTQKDRTAGKKKGAALTSKMPPKKTTSPQYDMLEDDHLSDHMQTLFNEENESFTPDASHTADESADEGDEGDDEEDEHT